MREKLIKDLIPAMLSSHAKHKQDELFETLQEIETYNTEIIELKNNHNCDNFLSQRNLIDSCFNNLDKSIIKYLQLKQ